MSPASAGRPRVGLLFTFDWDAQGFAALGDRADFDQAGFDLFSFPSNAHLIHFDLLRFAERQARRGRQRGWAGVVSHHEQFGALAAALVAERLGLPGTSPESILAAQHKLHARQVLQQVAPEANLGFEPLQAVYGGPVPDGLHYPRFVKPVKAAFSVLARQVNSQAELHAHTRFGRRELWVIRRLVEPFERVMQARLPGAGTAHRMMLEDPLPVRTPQFNLDGWVFQGRPTRWAWSTPSCTRARRPSCAGNTPAILQRRYRPARWTWRSASCAPSASRTACSTWSSFTTRPAAA